MASSLAATSEGSWSKGSLKGHRYGPVPSQRALKYAPYKDYELGAQWIYFALIESSTLLLTLLGSVGVSSTDS